MRKIIGAVFTLLGLILLFYSLFSFLNSKKVVSPVPLKEGVKVIELSPTP